MLRINDSVFVLVDVQGRLADVMHEKEELFANLRRLISGMHILGVPVIWVEQNPDKMGSTIPQLSELLESESPTRKMAFSCAAEGTFLKLLKKCGRRNVILAGIETHVCIYQTARELVELECTVEVVSDAVSSRNPANKQVALDRIRDCGARLTTTEMILFELMRTAKHPRFKQILQIVK